MKWNRIWESFVISDMNMSKINDKKWARCINKLDQFTKINTATASIKLNYWNLSVCCEETSHFRNHMYSRRQFCFEMISKSHHSDNNDQLLLLNAWFSFERHMCIVLTKYQSSYFDSGKLHFKSYMVFNIFSRTNHFSWDSHFKWKWLSECCHWYISFTSLVFQWRLYFSESYYFLYHLILSIFDKKLWNKMDLKII